MLTLQPGREGERGDPKTTLALLGSLCLFLSAIEYLIPKPLPFMRIGLANLPLLLALTIFDVKSAAGTRNFFTLVLIKVLGQGIIGGTLFSYVFLFSLAGTFTSASLMYLLRRLCGKYLGFAGLGCAGAMASNGIQLVLARYLIFGPALRYLVPPFLASGLVTGIALGLFCEYFCRRSRWYKRHTKNLSPIPLTKAQRHKDTEEEESIAAHFESSPTHTILPSVSPCLRERSSWDKLFSANHLFIGGLLMALIFVLGNSLPGTSLIGHIAQFLFFCLLACLSGKKTNLLFTILFMAGIVFFNLLAPYGKVLAAFGALRITEGSLFSGLEKALVLGGLLMLSRACISSGLKLPGVGSLLGESFRILELLREKKGLIKKGHIIGGIDQILLEIGENGVPAPDAPNPEDPSQNTPPTAPKRGIKGLLLVSLMVVVTLLLAILGACHFSVFGI